jgi:AAA15 family ATPase/GTPase
MRFREESGGVKTRLYAQLHRFDYCIPRIMVKHIRIQNFKSIKDLSFEARKINLFIGEPNTGKSNILEAMSLFAYEINDRQKFKAFFRTSNPANLFYNDDIDQTIKVTFNFNPCDHANPDLRIVQGHKEGYENYKFGFRNPASFSVPLVDRGPYNYSTLLNNDAQVIAYGDQDSVFFHLRFYRTPTTEFNSIFSEYLISPSGNNFPTCYRNNSNIRKYSLQLLEASGLELLVESDTNTLRLVKSRTGGVLTSFPYQSLSDTIRRLLFYYAAIETNQNAILLFEEPEAYTFPRYTKDLAERIVNDDSNQYFIVTHNPYLFSTILEKTPAEELNVFVTYMEAYQTKLRRIEDHELGELVDLGPAVFLNLDHFLPSADEQAVR